MCSPTTPRSRRFIQADGEPGHRFGEDWFVTGVATPRIVQAVPSVQVHRIAAIAELADDHAYGLPVVLALWCVEPLDQLTFKTGFVRVWDQRGLNMKPGIPEVGEPHLWHEEMVVALADPIAIIQLREHRLAAVVLEPCIGEGVVGEEEEPEKTDGGTANSIDRRCAYCSAGDGHG